MKKDWHDKSVYEVQCEDPNWVVALIAAVVCLLILLVVDS